MQDRTLSRESVVGHRDALSWLALAALVALYAATGALSPGYDDELFTIGWVINTDTLGELIERAARGIHPPGSYIVVSLLHDLTGSFPVIRAMAGVLNALMLWLLWRATAPRAPAAAAFAFLVLCLSPSLLLWGATVRWYSWFLPVLAGLLILIHRNPPGRWHFWGVGAALAAALVYMGYFALVLLPALLAAALWRRRQRLRGEWPAIAVTLALFFVAVAPQLLFVLPGQLKLGFQQHDLSLLRTVLGAGLQALSTHAAMPPSLPSAAFVLGNLILLGAAVRIGREAFAMPSAIAFLGGLATALAAGLTGHFRSLVVLSPAQGIWQGQLYAGLASRAWRGAAFCLFLVGTAIGIFNVVTHSDTTKGSWNTPYFEIIDTIDRFRGECPAALVVTHDPVLFWRLERRGTPVAWANTHTPPNWWEAPDTQFEETLEKIATVDCLIAVETFRGSVPPEVHRRYREAVAARPGEAVVERLGRDRHAWFKRRFDPAVPDHFAVVRFFPGRD